VAVVTICPTCETIGQDNGGARPQFTVSRATTFFTKPIRADGSIDFVAAINRRFGQGVKPQENACAYLHRAFGPIQDLPRSFYAELGIERPPARGRYLQPFPLPHPELSGEQLKELKDDGGRSEGNADDITVTVGE
jgi:hypothetical protein